MGHWDTLSMRILPAYLAYDWLDNNNAGRSLVNEEFDMRVCPQQQLKHGKLKHLYICMKSLVKKARWHDGNDVDITGVWTILNGY